jgi:DNA (cytosine-5)-methyltransferase 1
MLNPRELFRGQGFPDDYIIEAPYNGKKLPKTAQVRMCGNSVPPNLPYHIAKANFIDDYVA